MLILFYPILFSAPCKSREALRLDYEKQQEGDNPFFVKGTTYENIPHHESGHLIIQVFGLSPKKIIGDADQSLISDYARKNNKEAIAESFSAHYAGVKNETASHVKKNCDIIIAEEETKMTHNENDKRMLFWGHNKAWYGKDAKRGFYLRKAAPPEARESFKEWAAYQDSLGEDEAIDYTLEVFD